jgi:hypothetical protein
VLPGLHLAVLDLPAGVAVLLRLHADVGAAVVAAEAVAAVLAEAAVDILGESLASAGQMSAVTCCPGDQQVASEVAGLQPESQGAGQLVAARVTVGGTDTSEHLVSGW